jgi:hypothetical protein
MTGEELHAKMLEFIDTQDGEYCDEWYATRRDFAATVLLDFAEFLGVELVVPEYVPRLTRPQVDRNELLKALMPGIHELFNLQYQKMNDRLQQEWNEQQGKEFK